MKWVFKWTKAIQGDIGKTGILTSSVDPTCSVFFLSTSKEPFSRGLKTFMITSSYLSPIPQNNFPISHIPLPTSQESRKKSQKANLTWSESLMVTNSNTIHARRSKNSPVESQGILCSLSNSLYIWLTVGQYQEKREQVHIPFILTHVISLEQWNHILRVWNGRNI